MVMFSELKLSTLYIDWVGVRVMLGCEFMDIYSVLRKHDAENTGMNHLPIYASFSSTWLVRWMNESSFILQLSHARVRVGPESKNLTLIYSPPKAFLRGFTRVEYQG